MSGDRKPSGASLLSHVERRRGRRPASRRDRFLDTTSLRSHLSRGIKEQRRESTHGEGRLFTSGSLLVTEQRNILGRLSNPWLVTQ